jgi:hypothetical protein
MASYFLNVLTYDIACTGERTRTVTATAHSHAIPTTPPTDLAGTSPPPLQKG